MCICWCLSSNRYVSPTSLARSFKYSQRTCRKCWQVLGKSAVRFHTSAQHNCWQNCLMQSNCVLPSMPASLCRNWRMILPPTDCGCARVSCAINQHIRAHSGRQKGQGAQNCWQNIPCGQVCSSVKQKTEAAYILRNLPNYSQKGLKWPTNTISNPHRRP